MRLIVITCPGFFPEEAGYINTLFQNGLETLHLRKPHAATEDIRNLLKAIQPEYYPYIVLHDCFPLTGEFPLKGIHLNGRNPQPPTRFKGSISRSCHSLEEVCQWKNECDYVFLSPVYDSISKEGYASAFPPQVLQEAADSGIIDQKVVALGGVNASHIPELQSLRFGGAALLGDIWRQDDEAGFTSHFLKLKALCDNPM